MELRLKSWRCPRKKSQRNFHNHKIYIFLQEASNHTVIVAYIFLHEKETLPPEVRAI